MNHHLNPTFWKTHTTVGTVDPTSGGKLVFYNNSNFNGTFNWNTNGLTNGRHTLYFQVQESNASGVNASALAFFFDVITPAPNDPPTASNVLISGTAEVGQVLSGTYAYADAESDPQGASTFRWLRDGTPIAGATAQTYALVAADEGAMISFEVTPVAQTGTSPGVPVMSSPVGPVTAASNDPPVASNVQITGNAQVGQVLTGDYTYTDTEGDLQSASTFRWLRDGTPIAGATAQTYALVAADEGVMISFEVTPVAQTGISPGVPVVSDPVGPVTAASNDPPVASNVFITGSAQVGQVLTGGYTYTDTENDLEGASTFRWLRDNVAIAGATAQTYALVAADQGAMVSFEVTPVAQSGTSPGVPVVSDPVGPVAVGGGTGGPVLHEETRTGASSGLSSVTTTTALTGVTGQLYLAAISTQPNVTVSGVSGLGLTWTQVATQCSGRNITRATVFRAQGTPSGSGVVTATFSSPATNAVISVSRYSGASTTDPIGNVIAGNTLGPSGACSGGTDSKAYSFNLTTTVGGTVVYGSVALRNRTHTPGAGYTERSDLRQGSGSNTAGIASEDRSVATAGTVTVAGTISNTVDWAVIGVGIKPGGTPPPN